MSFSKKFLMIITVIFILCVLFFAWANYRVISIGSQHKADIETMSAADCIIVPGAKVNGDTVSISLRKRLDTAAKLYLSGKSRKVIVSGDHGTKEYDEVHAMKNYLMENGIDEEDIFMDHAGFDTYDTVYRAKHIFLAQNPVIVSQESHAVRAAYIADRIGMTCQYAAAEGYSFYESKFQIVRESLARVKAFTQCEILHSKSRYLGETIPVSGSGLATED